MSSLKNPNINPFGQWVPSILASLQNGQTNGSHAGTRVQLQPGGPSPGDQIGVIIDNFIETIAYRTAEIVVEMLKPKEPEETPRQRVLREIRESQATAANRHAAILTAIQSLPNMKSAATELHKIGGDRPITVQFEHEGRMHSLFIWAGEACNGDGRKYVEGVMPGEFGVEYNDDEHANVRLAGVRTIVDVVEAVRFILQHKKPCECMRFVREELCFQTSGELGAPRELRMTKQITCVEHAARLQETLADNDISDIWIVNVNEARLHEIRECMEAVRSDPDAADKLKAELAPEFEKYRAELQTRIDALKNGPCWRQTPA